jgi:hypothetical protein
VTGEELHGEHSGSIVSLVLCLQVDPQHRALFTL